jgi:hypothetical protein
MVEKKEVTAGERIVVGGTTLLPIVRTAARCWRGGDGVAGWASKEFVGLVVITAEGVRALDAIGGEVPVEDYASLVPEVDRLLRGS